MDKQTEIKILCSCLFQLSKDSDSIAVGISSPPSSGSGTNPHLLPIDQFSPVFCSSSTPNGSGNGSLMWGRHLMQSSFSNHSQQTQYSLYTIDDEFVFINPGIAIDKLEGIE